jgi:phosphoribosylanthranilate isomerase
LLRGPRALDWSVETDDVTLMSRTRIKICGITRLADAQAAERAGCDAVGLVFYEKSKRSIHAPAAREICAAVAPSIEKVGVFVSPTCDAVRDAAQEIALTAAQLCGPLPAGDWQSLASQLRLIRAIGVGNDRTPDFDQMAGVDDYLFDTRDDRIHGGTGRTFDWSLLDGKTFNRRIWLAGGLDAANVGRAIHAVRPYGVDVSTGVESEPGIKSAERIVAFVAAVRAADAQVTKGMSE